VVRALVVVALIAVDTFVALVVEDAIGRLIQRMKDGWK
jgi:hypothetical protein